MKDSFKLFIIAILLTASALSSCVASSNFYSAKTLEKNKIALSFGADDIVIKSTNNSVTVSKGAPFAPSLGIAYGLPLRLETSLRWYPTHFIEASLREQVNPRTFDVFDCSLNLSYAHFFGIDGYSYLKYGISFSKNINEFEPFVHYSIYHFIGANEGIFKDSFLSGTTTKFINNNRVMGFGIGLPLKKIKLFPEVDYQYFGNNLSNGLWHFGVGLRVYTN